MRNRNWIKTTASALALALLANGISASAQDKTGKRGEQQAEAPQRRQLEVIVQGPAGDVNLPPPPPEIFTRVDGGKGDTFVFVSTEMSFEGKTVKGAPYSAQAVTEIVQTLADGNRIVRKNSANIYRDSEGRTRREQTVSSIGPYAVAGDPPQTLFINDPVSGVNYILDPRTKTARKMNIHFRVVKPTEVLGAAKAPLPPPAESKPRVGGFTYSTTVPTMPHGEAEHVFFYDGAQGEAKKESLGVDTINGVKAEGTRITRTIPAGEIGNEQPINIVSERWYSNELQAVVMTRHSDPRHGETIYRLTNINRSEPARTLFEVPGDYTIKETPAFPQRTRRRIPAPSPDNL